MRSGKEGGGSEYGGMEGEGGENFIKSTSPSTSRRRASSLFSWRGGMAMIAQLTQ